MKNPAVRANPRWVRDGGGGSDYWNTIVLPGVGKLFT